MHDFDAIYREVGEISSYQILVVVLLTIPGTLLNSANGFALVFLAFTPKHSCHIPENLTISTISIENGSFDRKTFIAGQCAIYSNDSSSLNNNYSRHAGAPLEGGQPCPYGWDYDQTIMKSSLVTRWDLVCDRAIQPKVMISVLSVFTLIGCFSLSWIQDNYGRKWASMLCILIYSFGALLSIFMPTLLWFAVARAIARLPAISSWNVHYIWSLELVGASKRTIAGASFTSIYGISAASLGLVAFFLNNWFSFGMATSAPFLLLISYWWIVPESPRWLLAAGKIKETRAVLHRIAKSKSKQFTDAELDQIIGASMKPDEANKETSNTGKIADLFRGQRLRMKTLILMFAWIANAVTYYSIAFNSENLTDNFYMMYFLQAFAEFPANLIVMAMLDRLGRIWPFVGGMVGCTLFSLLTVIHTAPNWLVIAFATLSKLAICVSFSIIYQLASEIFPTPVRGLGVGFCSVVGEAGNIFMPYIIHSTQFFKQMPMIILALMCILCSLGGLALPETLGETMPDTLEDAELHLSVGWPAMKENFGRLKGALLTGKCSFGRKKPMLGGGKNESSRAALLQGTEMMGVLLTRENNEKNNAFINGNLA